MNPSKTAKLLILKRLH